MPHLFPWPFRAGHILFTGVNHLQVNGVDAASFVASTDQRDKTNRVATTRGPGTVLNI